MSRTYRRKHERHEYSWVLREWTFEYHSDAHFTLGSGPTNR